MPWFAHKMGSRTRRKSHDSSHDQEENSNVFTCFVCLVKLQNAKHSGKMVDSVINRKAHYNLHNICWKFLPGWFMQTEVSCGEHLFVVETAVNCFPKLLKAQPLVTLLRWDIASKGVVLKSSRFETVLLKHFINSMIVLISLTAKQ